MNASPAPLFLKLQDTQWPYTCTDHRRHVARAIAVDDRGLFYFLRVQRSDDFGTGVFIETAGGGVEPGEDPQQAVVRELREELGAQAEVLCKIGVVEDYYNLIRRHNINHYYLCRVTAFTGRQLTAQETQLLHLSTLQLSCEEAEAQYRRCADMPLGALLAARELPVLQRAKQLLASPQQPGRR